MGSNLFSGFLSTVVVLVACTSSEPAPPVSMSQPTIEVRHTVCQTDDDCTLWHAEYSAEGCCPTACDGNSPDAIPVNLEAYRMLDQHCYTKVVPRCDHSEMKFSCEGQPREGRCSAGRCAVHEQR